jgi:hypothetical protein
MVQHNQGSRVQQTSPKARVEHRFGGASRTRRIVNLLQHRAGSAKKKPASKHGRVFLFCGVILPLLAIAFEFTMHFCAQHFFDPFPSPNHIVLFLLIPLSNYLVWLSGRRDMSAHYGFMSLISGMAMGIGCLYALMFLPLTPHSALYTFVFGFGLLGFAPLLSVPCSWLAGKTVCRLASARKTFFDPHQVEHIGHLIVLCLVVAVELPSTMTRMNLSLAADPATSKQGVQWLRQFGSQEVMLRACYERSGRATDILGSLYESAHPLPVAAARSIFYQVTGKPFNSVPIPSSARATMQHAGVVDDPAGLNAGVQDEFDYDADIAGENVSGVARGLSVSMALITGQIDADAAVANLDWSIVLSNASKFDREARAKILLPPGAVVTKATVTVGGVEHDATILVRSLARAIYKQNVIEHKDPLLVSTCGLDQVLIQCFPVEPASTMKVRLKIAAPLLLSDDKRSANLVLPAFVERNFQFEVPDQVALTSGAVISGRPLTVSDGWLGKDHWKTFAVDPAQIARFESSVSVSRDPKISVVVADDTFANESSRVARMLVTPTCKMPEKLTILIDGSASMQHYMQDIAAGLRSIPPSVKTKIVIVGDDAEVVTDDFSADRNGTAFGIVKDFKAVGGHSDGEQLLKSLNDGPVLWIHGPQPVSTNDKLFLLNALRRPLGYPRLFDLQVAAGPNEYLNDLESDKYVARVPRIGSVADDMSRLFKSWRAAVGDNQMFRAWPTGIFSASATLAQPAQKEDAAPMQQGSLKQVTDVEDAAAIAQLYGYQELLRSYRSSNQAPALALAQKYHLVSPVSSAVVMDFVPASHPAPVSASQANPDEIMKSLWDAFDSYLRRGARQIGRLMTYQDRESTKYSHDNGEYSHVMRADEPSSMFLEKQKSNPFDKIQSSLKSLSSTSPPPTDIEFAQPPVAMPATPVADRPIEKTLANKNEIASTDGAGKDYVSDNLRSNRAAKQAFAYAARDEAAQAPPPLMSAAPMLQGATNGTIGPADSKESTASTRSGGSWADGWRMQSREHHTHASLLMNRATGAAATPMGVPLNWNNFGIQAQQERSYQLSSAPHEPDLRNALAIFALVFMSIYAGFKFLKAFQPPKNY